MTGPTMIVDGGLADLARAVTSAADHLAIGNDSTADAGAEGHEDNVLEAAASTAFPLGVGHAVRIVIHHHRQADFLFEDFLERDGFPTGDVG